MSKPHYIDSKGFAGGWFVLICTGSRAVADEKPRIGFAHTLRALAALLVVYCHLIGGRAEIYGNHWLPHTLFRTYVLDPIVIRQNFGFLGVALFFLISGFVIAYTASAETRLTFLVKRLFRIYPPLIAAILLAWGCYRLHALWLGHETASSAIPARDMFLSMATMEVLAGTPHGALDVGWTLSVEVIFYVQILAILPLVQRSAGWAAALLIVWGVLGTSLIKSVLDFPQLAEMTHYDPLFAIGIAIAGRYRTSPIHSGTLVTLILTGLCAYFYNLVTMKPWALLDSQMFAVQAVYAVALFIMFAFLDEKGRSSWFFGWVGNISYSLYLVHVPVGFLVADLVVAYAGVSWAIIAGLLAAFGAASLLNVLVERPSQHLARRMLKHSRTMAGASGETKSLQHRA